VLIVLAFVGTVSPEEILEDIKPYDSEQWKKFVETYVFPIQKLADTTVRNFIGDASAEAARIVSREAKRILEVSNRVLGPIEIGYEVPEDPIEAMRQLMERSANTFLGVDEGGKYSLFAWTLRKIPKEYFNEMYKKLDQDDAARERVFNTLGVKELFKPPVKSALADRLALLGYPDYLALARVESYGNRIAFSVIPARETTLGGSICRFVDSLVSLLSKPGILSGIELSIKDPVKGYLEGCRKMISLPPELKAETINWKDFAELIKFSVDYACLIEGFGVKIGDSFLDDGTIQNNYILHETNMLTMMRGIAPCLVLGVAELIIAADGRLMMLLERKV